MHYEKLNFFIQNKIKTKLNKTKYSKISIYLSILRNYLLLLRSPLTPFTPPPTTGGRRCC